MTSTERVHACYLHTCLRYLMHDYMTNESLRERFNISPDKSYSISKLIAATKKQGLIVPAEANQSNRFARYLPHWAEEILFAFICHLTNTSAISPLSSSIPMPQSEQALENRRAGWFE